MEFLYDSVAGKSGPWGYGVHHEEIPTLERAKELLGPKNDEIRKKRSSVYYNSKNIRIRSRLPIGMHDRCEEYVFAGGKIHEKDARQLKKHFPIQLKIIRLPEHTIWENQTCDISNNHKDWTEISPEKELYTYLHVDKLVVAPGARIVIYGNVLVFHCGEIVLDMSSSKKDYPEMKIRRMHDFSVDIFGTKHSGLGSVRLLQAKDGRHGFDGRNQNQVNPADDVVPSIFGPLDIEKLYDCDQSRIHKPRPKNGENGFRGEDGSDGQNGGMLQLANITIHKLTNFRDRRFRIFAQAGQGRNGGDGGDGGNGGLPSNIFVQIPQAYSDRLSLISQASVGGRGGLPGQGGLKGKSYNTDTAEKVPRNGKSGTAGINGKDREAVPIYVTHQTQQINKEVSYLEKAVDQIKKKFEPQNGQDEFRLL